MRFAHGGGVKFAALLLLLPTLALAQSGPAERLAEIGARENAVAQRLASERNRISRLLTALVMFRREPPPALIAPRDKALDAVRSAILAREMTPILAARARALSQQARRLAVLRRQEAAAAAELFALESARAEAERQSLSQTVGVLPAGHLAAAAPARAPRGLRSPIEGEIVRGFSPQRPGLVYRGQPGAAVLSPAAGVVEYVGQAGVGSLVVILGPRAGYHLVVAGLERALVRAGDSVSAGQDLGVLSRAPPDLYLELRRGDVAIDPSGALD